MCSFNVIIEDVGVGRLDFHVHVGTKWACKCSLVFTVNVQIHLFSKKSMLSIFHQYSPYGYYFCSIFVNLKVHSVFSGKTTKEVLIF